jgi:hypothetical protein
MNIDSMAVEKLLNDYEVARGQQDAKRPSKAVEAVRSPGHDGRCA